MDQAAKDALLERVRAYLDQPEQASAGPAGRDAQSSGLDETSPDLFSLLSELSALKNEVKLESRQVKAALDEFRGVFAAVESANERAEQEAQRRREQARQTRIAERKDLLLELLELRDRLLAGQLAAVGYRPRGLFGRGQAREFAASMAEGLGMNLRRLDETLARRGVQPLAVVGRSFDPHQMHAAELASDPTLAAGEVLAELRSGFLLDGELLRPAEVLVNRPDLAKPEPAAPSPSSTKDSL